MHVFERRSGFERVRYHAGQHHNVLADFHLVVECVKEGFEVLGVLVGVDGRDDLQEHHLSCPQQPKGCFPPLTRVALFRRHDSKVVETCFQRKVDAPHVPMLELQHRRELAADGLTEVAIFHGRKPHDGRREDGVGTAGDGGDVEDGVLAGQGIEAVMVTKGTLEFGFSGIAVPLNDDVRFCRHPQVLGEGLGDGERFLAQNTGKLVLREVVRKGRNG